MDNELLERLEAVEAGLDSLRDAVTKLTALVEELSKDIHKLNTAEKPGLYTGDPVAPRRKPRE
jgi:prefoldin subunit 5